MVKYLVFRYNSLWEWNLAPGTLESLFPSGITDKQEQVAALQARCSDDPSFLSRLLAVTATRSPLPCLYLMLGCTAARPPGLVLLPRRSRRLRSQVALRTGPAGAWWSSCGLALVYVQSCVVRRWPCPLHEREVRRAPLPFPARGHLV